jgi:hypothetical protein
MPLSKTATGRTTRMMRRAISLAIQGRAVYILAASKSHKKQLDEMRAKMEPRSTGIQFLDASDERDTAEINWHTLSLNGAHPNCILLCDHFALEVYFTRVFEEWTRYDAPEHHFERRTRKAPYYGPERRN